MFFAGRRSGSLSWRSSLCYSVFPFKEAFPEGMIYSLQQETELIGPSELYKHGLGPAPQKKQQQADEQNCGL